MPRAIVNGREADIPSPVSDSVIRQVGNIDSGRTLIRRHGSDGYVVPSGSVVDVNDGDMFVDAPARIKG